MKRCPSLASAALALAVLSSGAHADDLKRAYEAVLDDPANSDLNLNYARLAELQSEYRLALAAYERILLNDPDNQSAKDGLQRIRRVLQPAFTRIYAETGASWESNPRLRANEESDLRLYGNVQLRDERRLGSRRWRTNGLAYGDFYSDSNDLDFARLSGDVGPIIDIPGTFYSFRPALGGSYSMLNGNGYNWDIGGSALIEGYLDGAYQSVRIRGGYRQFDDRWTSDDGFYGDVLGKVAFPHVICAEDVLAVSSWTRWSNVDGAALSIVPGVPNSQLEVVPGKFVEGGLKIAYETPVTNWLSLGAHLSAISRYYLDEPSALQARDSRNDWYLIPGVSAVVPGALSANVDLRLDYSFEWVDSNLSGLETDNNHSVGAALVLRN